MAATDPDILVVRRLLVGHVALPAGLVAIRLVLRRRNALPHLCLVSDGGGWAWGVTLLPCDLHSLLVSLHGLRFIFTRGWTDENTGIAEHAVKTGLQSTPRSMT